MSDVDEAWTGAAEEAAGARLIPAREAIAEAFARIGGVDRLVAWIQEDPQNERIFLDRIYPKLLSHQPVEPPRPMKRIQATVRWKPPQ